MFPAALIWSCSKNSVNCKPDTLIRLLGVFHYCLFRVLVLFRRKKQGSSTVPESVLDAIKLGIWDFEPEKHESNQYSSTHAMPGTHEKLAILSARVSQGLPLWHPDDRRTYDDTSDY